MALADFDYWDTTRCGWSLDRALREGWNFCGCGPNDRLVVAGNDAEEGDRPYTGFLMCRLRREDAADGDMSDFAGRVVKLKC